MEDKKNITEMQQASDYRTMSNALRGGGIGSIIFGIIGIAMGLFAIEENSVNAVLVVIGAILVLEGIWVVSAPSPCGMIADGIAMLLVGVWNIFVTVNNMSAGGGLPIFGVLGAYQIYWGFQRFGQYGRFAAIQLGKPSKEILAQIDEMVKVVLSAKPEQSDCVLEFQEGQKSWKGKFFGEMAVLVKGAGEDVLFTDRNQMNIISKRETKKGKLHEIQFQFKNRSIDGTISPQSFSIYEQWKLAAA